MLYAGTTWLLSFKYSILNDIVKKLKQSSKSAGNNSIYENIVGTSETLRNEIAEDIKIDKIKPISVHVPVHKIPANDNEFGHYLAGLIEGDGHFSSKQQLVIVFNSSDNYLAYLIKRYIGYGSVHKVKNKNAVLLIIAAKEGIIKIINLINGKIRTKNKFDQIINNILNHPNFSDFNKTINFKLNLNNDLRNYWLAGVSDADASFQIKTINRNNKTEIRLNFQIDQKKEDILIKIKSFLGGNIGYRKSQDTYYYGSTSFGSAKKVINYFDHFHLLSSKHVNYLKWRKVYLIIQKKDHLNNKGIERIIKLKKTMNSFNNFTAI